MNFAKETYFIPLILGLPAMLMFFIWAGKQRKRALERFAGSALLERLTRSVSPVRQRWKAGLLLLACAFIGLALTQPRWGETEETVKRSGIEILIAVDVSKSMRAEDLKPNRITKARREIQDLLGQLEGHRVGLIAFAGEAFVHCPPTTDLDACGLFIESIDVGLIQRGGTQIGDAIREANKVFRESSAARKALILITDGEDHETEPIEAAKDASKIGVHIYAIGMGTPDGSLIPMTDETGNRVFLKDRQGQVVKAHLDEETLQKVVLETGGAYHRVTAAGLELDGILQKINALEKSELESQKLQRYQHRYQLFLLVAFVLLLVESLMSDRRRVREESAALSDNVVAA